MYLMQARLENLKQTFLGLQKTGIPLIQYDGQSLSHSFTADDTGIYILIPKLAHLFNIPIESAINFFFYGLILIPSIIGILGFIKYYSQPIQQLIATLSILMLMRQASHIGDVYIAYYAAIITIIPWFLYFTKNNSTRSLYLFSFCSGLFLSFLGCIRAYSGLGVILFALSFLILKPTFSKKEFTVLLLIFLCGSRIPIIYFNYEYNRSVKYAKTELQSNIGKQIHTFWHPMYLGFGLLNYKNQDNINYDDYFAFAKADAIRPGVEIYSQEYENILKNEIINLVKNRWQFVLFTLFAKIGILLFYLLKYANIGLVAAFFYRKPWFLEVPFWIGIAFYALFPLLTMPTFIEYVLGFISFVTLYSVISINYSIEQGCFNFFKRSYRSIAH